MASNTFKITESELLKLGFSAPAAKAIQRVLTAIGNPSATDPTLTELSSMIFAFISTANNHRSEIADLRSRIANLESNPGSSSRLLELAKRIDGLESRVSTS